MAFFARRDPAREAGAALDADRLARGQTPLGAERRLSGRAAFSAAFSPTEFALLAGDDVLPVGVVTGSCVYHVGRQWPPLLQSMELSPLTAAHLQVRRRALDRLQQEAALLGAHGVLGVTLKFSTRRPAGEEGGEQWECSATGTAVRLTRGEPPPRPFLCDLNASGFWTLRRVGYRPCGIALGACVWYHAASPTLRTSRSSRMGRGPRENVEFVEYSLAVRETRRLATDRLAREAAQGMAEGVLGLSFDSEMAAPYVAGGSSYRVYDLVLRCLAQGTAITPHRDRWPVIDYAVSLTG